MTSGEDRGERLPDGGEGTRCGAYYYGSGVIRFAGRRCEREAGHAGQHVCPRFGLGAPFTFTWGRDTRPAWVRRAMGEGSGDLPSKVYHG